MSKVLGLVAGILFAAFCIAILGLLMSLTFGALGKLFPDNFTNQVWGLVLFDIAAMIWALAFVFKCKSALQYAAAALGFVAAFVGTLGMVAVEVLLSGQEYVTVQSWVGQWMVYGFIIVTAIHAGLIYLHHSAAPEIHQQINVGIARGEIVTEAISQATKTLEMQKLALAQSIHAEIVAQVKRDLGLHRSQVLDLPALPVDNSAPYPVTFAKEAAIPLSWDWLWSKFKSKPKSATETPAPVTDDQSSQVSDDHS